MYATQLPVAINSSIWNVTSDLKSLMAASYVRQLWLDTALKAFSSTSTSGWSLQVSESNRNTEKNLPGLRHGSLVQIRFRGEQYVYQGSCHRNGTTRNTEP